jgi:hypothetical protein
MSGDRYVGSIPPRLTVKEAFALAGVPIPDDATRLVAYFIPFKDDTVEGNAWSATGRNWVYRTPTGYGVFDCLDAPGEWTQRASQTLDELVMVAELSINLSNLPAADCLAQLPERVQVALASASSVAAEEVLNDIERLRLVTGERDRFKLLLEQAIKSGGLDRPIVTTWTSEPCHELRAYLREGLKQDQGEGEG